MKEALRSITVIAKEYDGSEELKSTGISSGTAVIPRFSGKLVGASESSTQLYGEAFFSTLLVPMQLDLSADTCDRIDGLCIDFASCAFGDVPSDNVWIKLRFASTSPSRPHYP